MAATLVLLAAVLAFRPTEPDGAPSYPVLVAARDLPPGSSLTPADVRVAMAPADLRPATALSDTGQVSGRVLATGAGKGEPITTAKLVGPEHTRLVTGREDSVAVPVRLSDPAVADLLRSGARVDVVTLDPGGSSAVLAEDATVVTVINERADGGADAGRLVVIALPRVDATRVASVALGQPVAVTLR